MNQDSRVAHRPEESQHQRFARLFGELSPDDQCLVAGNLLTAVVVPNDPAWAQKAIPLVVEVQIAKIHCMASKTP